MFGGDVPTAPWAHEQPHRRGVHRDDGSVHPLLAMATIGRKTRQNVLFWNVGVSQTDGRLFTRRRRPPLYSRSRERNAQRVDRRPPIRCDSRTHPTTVLRSQITNVTIYGRRKPRLFGCIVLSIEGANMTRLLLLYQPPPMLLSSSKSSCNSHRGRCHNWSCLVGV